MGRRLRDVMSSVRVRTTVGAMLVLALALLLASIALVTLTQRAMQRNVTSAARLRAVDLVASIESGQPLPSLTTRDDDVFVQIVDEEGTILASSPSLEGDPVVASLQPGGATVVEQPPNGDDDPFVVVAQEARTPDGSLTVLVGRNLDLVGETTVAVIGTLAAGVPLLILVVGITTWKVTGRSLSPVEHMRQEVADVSHADLSRRLHVPPGDDEITRLARTLNQMLERLDEAHRREQRFVSDASHELRNPIATIRHLTEVALAHPDRTSVETMAAEILAEDLRLQDLAEGLLLLARADEHTLEMSRISIDLDDLVLEEARRLKERTTLRIETTKISAARTVGDRAQLQRVLRNLGDNAARHASATIGFSVQSSDEGASFTVDDDGPGVAHEARHLIFERFARLDEARDRERGGAGLGLSIVKEIVSAHEGRVVVGESPLGGARFEVFLPAEM